eukprot:2574703-Rhodomonas_salina.2
MSTSAPSLAYSHAIEAQPENHKTSSLAPQPSSSRVRKGLAHSSLARQSSPHQRETGLLLPLRSTNPGSSRPLVPLVRCRGNPASLFDLALEPPSLPSPTLRRPLCSTPRVSNHRGRPTCGS